MSYVESFVLPVKAAEFETYRKVAADGAVIWRELGALQVIEARADNAPHGEVTSFPRSVMAAEDEVVVVSYILFTDRAHRDAVMEVAMADPRLMAMMETAPVDGKRMIWGGFDVFVNES